MQYYRIDYYRISSVLEQHHRGPIKALIKWPAAAHLKLTGQEFPVVVRNEAKQSGVAEGLEAYDSNRINLADAGKLFKL